jgi:hypothetical protein
MRDRLGTKADAGRRQWGAFRERRDAKRAEEQADQQARKAREKRNRGRRKKT